MNLQKARSVLVSIMCSAAIVSSTATAGAEQATGAEGGVVEATSAIGFGGTFSLDSTSGEVAVEEVRGISQVDDAAGKVSHQKKLENVTMEKVSLGDMNASADFTCIIKTQANNNFRAYNPLRMRSAGNSFDAEYLIHPYSVDFARFVSSEWKFQVETCLTGGGDVRNDYRQSYNGAAMFVVDSADRRIGHTWGTNSKFQNGSISSTLSFQVTTGPVEIGASTTVTFTDEYAGTAGADGNMTTWPYSVWYDGNRVNSYYKGGHDWVWQGSPDYQGNNGHALYEWSMNTTAEIRVGGWRQLSAHCGLIGGGCAPFS